MKKRFLSLLCILAFSLVAPQLSLAAGKGVVLNFTDVDIATMVKFVSDLTGKNFIMDDRVKGKISVFSPAKLSTEEAFNVFTSVLELKGFTIVQAGKVYKVVPIASVKQAGVKIFGDGDRGPVNESYVARVITLENIEAKEAVNFLQPMVSKDGYIAPFGPANMVLVVDSALNIQKLLGLVGYIDADRQRDMGEVIYLKNASAESAASLAREWLGKGRSAATGASSPASLQGANGSAGTGTGETVVADMRLNALIVFGSARDKEDIKKLVALVDVVPPTSSSKVNVYYMEQADATEIVKVLEGVVKGSSSTSAAPASGSGQGSANAPVSSPFDGSKMSITADKATNSLVIMASPNDYQNLLQVIKKLDRRRRQVFVEAVIAEVSLDKLRDIGVQSGVIGGGGNSAVAALGFYDPFSTLTPILGALSSLSQSGITNSNINLTSAANIPVILHALDSNGIINVLSTPTILTSDNKEAEIFVGENVPFLGNIQTLGTGISQQSVDHKDTGITLRLTPQISEGEYVKLDLYQEISAIKDTITSGTSSDFITTKRSAKTSVVVKDAETVVIGGLIQDQDNVTIAKVPFLGDIPGLGWFFKYKKVEHQKTNLMILLTPRIVKDAADLRRFTDENKARFSSARTSDASATKQIEEKFKP